jgi:UDP-glucuronate 4-epimerase
MKVLVTGAAGFIGSHLCKSLLKKDYTIVGIDNHNNYYNPKIKEDRVKSQLSNDNYTHCRMDICDKHGLVNLFKKHKPDKVVNLAAQAGVRYSINNPDAYIQSNISGFINILECCRWYEVNHLVYASTSSVYGANTKMPFSEHDNTNHPLSLYAATKKSNELMAHTYSHLFNLPTTGLRFFTVYGPWGRPDMALFKFTQSILSQEPINVYNFGNHTRDFTYIDDIIGGIIKVLDNHPSPDNNWSGDMPDPATSNAPWKIFNIGNNKPVQLMDYIYALETSLGKKAQINYLPLQQGDVTDTCADITEITKNFQYSPNTSISEGIKKFVDWYCKYYEL